MKILVAEDEEMSRRLLTANLSKKGYEVVPATNGREAWDLLQTPEAPQIAILDWTMPEMDGVDVCVELRKKGGEPYVYVILLSAKSKKEEVIEGLRAGADDYLVKPCHPLELIARVRSGVRILDLQKELIEAREALRIQATQDALTGCWNRRTIFEILDREFQRAKRETVSIGVVLGDLDHFKHINDTHGHQVGDLVLQESSRRMRSMMRQYDAVGRYGGEEFLMVLPGCDWQKAVNQAERVRTCLESKPIVLPDGQPITVTMSLGVSASDLHTYDSVDALVHAADQALYRAKNSGRNRTDLTIPWTVQKNVSRLIHSAKLRSG